MKTPYLQRLFVIAVLGIVGAILPATINAQLRYQTRYSKADVSRIIAQLESSSNTFRSDFDEAMDRSPLNGTDAEDRYNRDVSNYENSLDRLRKSFDRNNSWWDNRNDVSNVIQKAQPVNSIMNTISFRRNLERQWNSMRNDLNTLADTFDLPGLNGGGWNGGGGNGGGWGGSGNTSTPPSWAQGTFYATNGMNITVSIDRNGRVTVINDGQTYYGTYYRGNLTLNGDVSSVSQSGNGISTYNRNTGQTTVYSRNSGGWGGNGNGNGGNWGNGQTSNPPSWAVGTFYSTDGSGITLTVNSNGRITVVNGGQTFYGTYYRGNMTVNGDVSTLSQSGDGIRTYNRNLGQTTVYSRRNSGGWGNGNGNGNGGWNGSGNTSTPPSWAQGTFYSNDGSNITLIINRNGQITAVVGGQSYYGTYYNGSMTLNGDVSTISRNGNGIQTYNVNSRQTTIYRR